MKKKLMPGLAVLLGLASLFYGIFTKVKGSAAIAIIGGADGPTSVFVVGKVPAVFSVILMIIGILLLIVAGILLVKRKGRT